MRYIYYFDLNPGLITV